MQKFIVVNDGSTTPVSKEFFDCLNSQENIKILTHEKNRGKGRALKTVLQFFLENFPESPGVIAMDSDGQHLPEDVYQIIQEMQEDYAIVFRRKKVSDRRSAFSQSFWQ